MNLIRAGHDDWESRRRAGEADNNHRTELSRQRVHDFITLMSENNISPMGCYVERPSRTYQRFGEGWLISESRKHLDRESGLVVVRNGLIYGCDSPARQSLPGISEQPYILIDTDISSGSPVERDQSTFDGEHGQNLLVWAAEKLGAFPQPPRQ
jgi:hypothetical protein